MSQPNIQDVRNALIAHPGETFDLASRPTRHPNLFDNKQDARASLLEDAQAIDELQDRLYADHKTALLVVLQGIDTSGKSGVIRSVFAQTSPLGVEVKAFKAPSRTEADHDYLRRVHQVVPGVGKIGIFDRSHYEDVLVTKVRELFPGPEIEARYTQINQFEHYLTANRVHVLKCMLNVSFDRQGERLLDRLEVPEKRWKFNPSDLDDRARWSEFMAAYETAVDRCSTEHAPWYVIPADSRTRRNAMVARLVRGALEDIAPEYPDPGYRPDQFEL